MKTSEPERRRALKTLLVASVALFVLCAFSRGVYHEDGLTHFMLARGTSDASANWFDAWGRPGTTAFFAPFALVPDQALGWFLARLASAAAVVVTAWAAYRTAARLGLERASLAAAAVVIQPLTVRLGFDTMTEVPCALWLALAIERASARRVVASAAWLSLCFITRFETLVFVPVWAWAVFPRRTSGTPSPSSRSQADVRRFVCGALALAWAPVGIEIAAWATGNASVLAVLLEPAPHGGDFYGRGSLASTPSNWLLAVGPLVGLLAVLGIPGVMSRGAGRLAVGAGVAYVGAHTVLFALNMFASGGYPRFHVVVAAPSAILAVAGLQWLRRGGSARIVRAGLTMTAIAIACAVLAVVNFTERYPAASPAWRWAIGGGALLSLGLATAGFIAWRRTSGDTVAWRRGARTLAIAVVVLQSALFAGFVRGPARRTERQANAVAAARWVAGQPWVTPTTTVLGTSDWITYTLDLPRPVGVPYAWDQLGTSPSGTVYVCDVAPGDWRLRVGASTIAEHDSDPALEKVYTVGRGDMRVAVFVRR